MKKSLSLVSLVFVSLVSYQLKAYETLEFYQSIVSHKDRLQSDLKYDQARKPLDILPFTRIKPGDSVLELGAGGGYTTELVSWLVGDTGKVYAHFLYNQKRLENNRLANVVSLPRHSLNDHRKVLVESGVDANSLDAVIVFFVLHDIYLNNEMSEELLATIYSSLKPGGKLIILDNAAEPDSGLTQIETLHRIGENFVKAEMTKAGFILEQSTDVLRNSNDDHSKPWGDFKGMQDRFAFRFVKPEK